MLLLVAQLVLSVFLATKHVLELIECRFLLIELFGIEGVDLDLGGG